MSKHKYRATRLQDIDVTRLATELHERAIIAIDMAKVDVFAAVMDRQAKVLVTVKYKQPAEGTTFVGFVKQLEKSAGAVEVVMEPTGTYGDPLRSALEAVGIAVRRVSPKRCHDAAEVYDGVPSSHDAKSAAIIGKLHLDGASEPWPIRDARERDLAAALAVLTLHDKEFSRNRQRLEGLMARYWPELGDKVKLGSATCLELLMAYGGPAAVAAAPEEARRLMRSIGGAFLDEAKIDHVIDTAMSTFGMPQVQGEVLLVQTVATQARRAQKELLAARRSVAGLVKDHAPARAMRPTVGMTTAGVLVASTGDPRRYHSPHAWLKALGLNLKETSSGKKQGYLHITRRGPAIARKYLYMAALRAVHREPIIRAWYAKAVVRSGGKAKPKAVVAVMRKIALGLWHASGGVPFDSAKLFDTARLGPYLAAAK